MMTSVKMSQQISEVSYDYQNIQQSPIKYHKQGKKLQIILFDCVIEINDMSSETGNVVLEKI